MSHGRAAGVLVSLAVAIALLLAPGAQAATITPNIQTDELDNTGTDLGCSLREAISVANANDPTIEPACVVDTTADPLGTNDKVQLGAGTYTLSRTGFGEDANDHGDLDVTQALTIDGAGAGPTGGTTISTASGWTDRVLQALGGGLTVSDLTVTGGAEPSQGGGGIRADSGVPLTLQQARITGNKTDANGGGGGVFAAGPLTVTDSEISSNVATTQGGGISSFGPTDISSSVIKDNKAEAAGTTSGGGIDANFSDVTVTHSVVSGNQANNTSGGSVTGIQRGGGFDFENASTQSLTIKSSTVSGNSLSGGTGAHGGGIEVGTGSMKLVNSTLTGNTLSATTNQVGSGLALESHHADVINSTVGVNPAPFTVQELDLGSGTMNMRGSVLDSQTGNSACDGTPTSGGRNVSRDTSCGLTGPNDIEGMNPNLGPLQDNGGDQVGAPGFLQSLPTQELLAGSPAVDEVPTLECLDENSVALTTDERGDSRPFGSACDAGAFENQAPTLPPTTDFTVDSTGDQADTIPGDGVCQTAGSTCTLRAAIQEANNNGDPTHTDTIDATSVTGQIVLGSALPSLNQSVTITGPGASHLDIHRSSAVGTPNFSVIGASPSPGTDMSISGVTISNGALSGSGAGAGISNVNADMTLDGVRVTGNNVSASGTGDQQAAAAGILNAGANTLTIRNSTIDDNHVTATSTAGAATAQGAGITNGAGLHIDHSTISGNTATATAATNSVGAEAGITSGINNPSDPGSPSVSVKLSTISGNVASISATTTPQFSVGGIDANKIDLTSDTIAFNSAPLSANLSAFTGNGMIKDTIVSNPRGGGTDCNPNQVAAAELTSGGYNLVDDGSCFDLTSPAAQPTDLSGVNPKLGALAGNGGPTKTHALLAGSAAIDKGKDSLAASFDQRGTPFPRKEDAPGIANASGGDGTDIGAFERDVFPPSRPGVKISINHGSRKVKAKFSSHDNFPRVTYKCRFDHKPYRTCRSPKKKTLSSGRHKFQVRAYDAAGNRSSVKTKKFTV